MIPNELYNFIMMVLILISTMSNSTQLVTVTAYAPETVDPRWGGVARWTNAPPIPYHTASCDPSLKGYTIKIEGMGEWVCEDTPAVGVYEYCNDPEDLDQDGDYECWQEWHIDVFAPDKETANQWGKQIGLRAILTPPGG